MTYDAPLKKFLMCITDGGNTISKFNTYILESDHITGPWKLVVYMREFGEQAYFVNIPSKFISAGRPDGVALLCGQLYQWLPAHQLPRHSSGRRLRNDFAGDQAVALRIRCQVSGVRCQGKP